ncbi:MAG: hypothetical protein ACYCZ2_14850 [Lutibacter sp.]
MDISDFKINLESCFYAELPKKGNFDINFLNELLPQIFFKYSLLEGLKFQIENLNTELELPKNDLKELQNIFYKSYSESIVIKLNLLIEGFEISLQGTINRIELIENEISNIDKIFKGKLDDTLTVFDFTNILKIEPKNIKNTYKKLVRGLEINILENIDLNNLAEIDNLETTKALFYFKEYLYTLITPLLHQKVETEQKTPTFENKFNKVEPMDIYNYFKTGLVEKGYLNEQELVEYLKAAFELNTIPKTLFKIKDAPTKQKIIKIFYGFYKNIAGTPHGKQKSYAALLGNYFEGFNTENVSTNFSK